MTISDRKGISVLSTLVTLAVVAVLFSIAFSAFSKTLERSKSVTCVSNLRQIGVALQLYMADNDGRYPPNRANKEYHTEKTPAGVHHQDYLKHYLTPYPDSGTITAQMAGVFWCPADLPRLRSQAQHSYGANNYIGGGEPAERQYISREPNPSERLYLLEGMRASRSTCLFSHNTWPFNNGPIHAPNTDIHVDFRHGGFANGLYLDGHVATFTVEHLRGQDPRELISQP